MAKTIVEYIYYRLNKFYLKSDGRTGIRSILLLSFIYAMIIFDLFLIATNFLNNRERIVAEVGQQNLGTLAFAIFILLCVISHFQFKDKYNYLKKKWQNEEREHLGIGGKTPLEMLNSCQI